MRTEAIITARRANITIIAGLNQSASPEEAQRDAENQQDGLAGHAVQGQEAESNYDIRPPRN